MSGARARLGHVARRHSAPLLQRTRAAARLACSKQRGGSRPRFTLHPRSPSSRVPTRPGFAARSGARQAVLAAPIAGGSSASVTLASSFFLIEEENK